MITARQIIHVDMDAFYASVEQLDNPELVGKAVIVGGSPEARGVVSAASYEARKSGVHSAMPMARAIKLCPNAIVLPVRMERYAEVSGQIHKIFERYTPQIEPISLDEAFLDVTGSIGLFGSSEKIGLEIKRAIRNELKLTASIGVAPNKFLAKLGSDLKKPDGFVVITEENKQEILDPLPVRKIWGVGKATGKALQSRNIGTIAQLRNTPIDVLQNILGNQAEQLLQLAQGIDDREVQSIRQAKSISSEETFAVDIEDKEVLLIVLHNQVEEVTERLRAEGLEAKTITLKLRYGNFRTVTRSSTLISPTNITKILGQEAEKVFDKWYKKEAGALRLIGLGVSGLVEEGKEQEFLFLDPEEEKEKRLDRVVDQIKDKYGSEAVRRGES